MFARVIARVCSRVACKQHHRLKLTTNLNLQNRRNLMDEPSSTRLKLQVTEQGFSPRRAVLYVPGSDDRKLAKLCGLKVDCAVMDCEDGVAANRKDEARQTIKRALGTLQLPNVRDVAVRINAVESGLAEDDLRVVLQADRIPDTLMLPKVESICQLQWLADKLAAHYGARLPSIPLKLVIFIESAIGLLRLAEICSEGQRLSQTTQAFVLEGVVFGSDDFCADIGATRTSEAMELLYARQKVVVVAKAYRLQAIDLVHINYKDLRSLEQQSLEGARMGFTGKQVIHPTQIPVVQQAFSPSPEKIEWAKALTEAFEEHQKSGKGAFAFRDSMIDMPSVLQARNILQMAKQS